MIKLKEYDIGVIIGRFQVEQLHDAHHALIQEVIERHNNRIIIFVGVSPAIGTKEQPLDFKSRKEMIESTFPNIIVAALPDMSCDLEWSKNLDRQIRTIYPTGTVCLYGGRDSFIKYYKGVFDAHEFPTHDYRPGKEVREDLGKLTCNNSAFRHGIIYSTQNQYPRTHLTVDIAVYLKNTVKTGHKDSYDILLGRKPNEKKYRFIGGFVDNEPLEMAALREVQEECGAELDEVSFICSLPIQDWRYRNTSDTVITTFFASEYLWGGSARGKREIDDTEIITENDLKAGDDLEEIKWFHLMEVYNQRKELVVESHIALLEKLVEYFKLVIKKEKNTNESLD